jgi:hypothetical protein
MAELSPLKNLAAQKSLLQAESELYRTSIRVELDGLKRDTAWAGRSMDWVHRYRPLILLVAAPLFGFLMVRSGGGVKRLLLGALAAFRIFQRTRGLASLLLPRP